MFNLLLAASLICPNTLILNKSSVKWNKRDTENYSIAIRRCGELYMNSPCLKKFIKVKPLTYHAICGKPSKQD